MEYNQDKVDDMVLALMYLASSTNEFGTRAWKGLDIKILDRLVKKGLVSDPGDKSPTLLLSPEGADRSKRLFEEYFSSVADE